jgi:hypothetical protein
MMRWLMACRSPFSLFRSCSSMASRSLWCCAHRAPNAALAVNVTLCEAQCARFPLMARTLSPNEKVLIRRAAAWWIKPVGLNRWIQRDAAWSL